MSTGVIIALIVIVAAVIAVAAILAARARGSHGGRSLKQRFGPEYDRAVARHDGDVKAAERELGALVERHGGLHERPLEPAERERFEARWTAAQERFVDSPREAVAEADRLLAEVAGARGFPDGAQYEEQVAALSVHHADHVHGYRRVHQVARVGADGGTRDGRGPGTEDLRAAMVDGRALFDDLVGQDRHMSGRHRARTRHDDRRATRAREGHHLPWSFHRHQTKEG
ncbi:hypothetical protein [Streptomyces aurantiogriseus]|uniref:Secreted protein n=1 Tax=Streptomyces aurantiogriseus TaxID=66870 RepID=A0A918CLS6_9ACTN|nr:hypothetical protein [Streptomyces aurantiogriseus]GGR30458.1 hypothetical protein GCM10010251_53090 [Streptomyces aurantiogriseus]